MVVLFRLATIPQLSESAVLHHLCEPSWTDPLKIKVAHFCCDILELPIDTFCVQIPVQQFICDVPTLAMQCVQMQQSSGEP